MSTTQVVFNKARSPLIPIDALLDDTIFMSVFIKLGIHDQVEAWGIHGFDPEDDM